MLFLFYTCFPKLKFFITTEEKNAISLLPARDQIIPVHNVLKCLATFKCRANKFVRMHNSIPRLYSYRNILDRRFTISYWSKVNNELCASGEKNIHYFHLFFNRVVRGKKSALWKLFSTFGFTYKQQTSSSITKLEKHRRLPVLESNQRSRFTCWCYGTTTQNCGFSKPYIIKCNTYNHFNQKRPGETRTNKTEHLQWNELAWLPHWRRGKQLEIHTIQNCTIDL